MESYEYLAMVTTVHPAEGVVSVRCDSKCLGDVDLLLSAIDEDDLPLVRLATSEPGARVSD